MNKHGKHKPLTKSQQKLVEDHLWVAGRQAYKHYTLNGGHTGLFTREDLESVGRYALCVAASRWDESRGVKFSTYAWTTVSGYIQHSLRDHSRMVRVPRWILYIRHTALKLLQEGKSNEEIMVELSLSEEQILMISDSWKESYKSLDYSSDEGKPLDLPYYDKNTEDSLIEIHLDSVETLANLSDSDLKGFEKYVNGGRVSKSRAKKYESILEEIRRIPLDE